MKLKKVLLIACCILTIALWTAAQKPRLLITTDIGGDPDDTQSLIRLMLYTCDFEIEGIISSASGTPGELGKSIIRPDLIEEIIQAYGEVYPNLIKHKAGFPTKEYLMSVVKSGNPMRGWNHVGEGHDTEASEWIIRCADDNDPRPLNIAIWGGQTDVAQALWKVKNTRTDSQYNSFISKLRIYDIADQDGIFSEMWKSFPGLFYVLNKAPEGQDKRNAAFRGMYLGGNEDLTSLDWITENIIKNHGPLGKLYPVKTWTAPNPHGVMKEGDTPSWFFFLKNGLNFPDLPEYGGWGGRFQKTEEGYYADAIDSIKGEINARATVYRWRDDFQRDFAARMDWCIQGTDDINHSPMVVVNKHKDIEPLLIRRKPGKKVELDASGSKDSDGNLLSFEWLVYPEAGNFDKMLTRNPSGRKTEFTMPDLGKNSKISIVLKVTDNGNPNLSGYKRIILMN
jgi:hypothetical protein